MNLKDRFALCAPICLAASLATVCSTNAAVSVTVAQLTSPTQLLNTGTQVIAWDIGGNVASPVVNGITFNTAQPGTVSNVTGWAGTLMDSPTTAYSDTGLKEVLSDFLFSPQGALIISTLRFDGLTIGQDYRVQFLHYQEGTVPAARQFEVFLGNTSGTSTGIFAPAGLGNAYISTFNFTATDSDSNIGNGGEQLFTFRASSSGADDRSILNAATLFVVPEPSVAMLGGLGVLGLLRRRRA